MMKHGITISPENLGYDEFFESGRQHMGLSEYPVSRVISEHREAYTVRNTKGEYFAKITGKRMFTATGRADYPAVGDWVAITELEHGTAVIRGILPRKTILTKKYSAKQDNQIIATNIDTAFITESMDRDYNLNRIERFLVLTREGKISPVILLNKADLISVSELASRIRQIKERFENIEVLTTSVVTKRGTMELRDFIQPGNTYCFLGSSGVGKSSLINELLGINEIKTGEISNDIQRGKHTTTARGMYFLENGGIVIDNPGTREVGIADSEEGIVSVFDAIGSLSGQCRFPDCSHRHEPGCAVLEALKDGTLDKGQYDNYIRLEEEAAFYRMTDLEKRTKDHKFGKFVKNALKDLNS